MAELKNFARSRIQSSGVRARKFFDEAFVPIVFLFFSFFLMFHTFGYDRTQKNILIARTLWSDFGSHIPLIRSFSMGNNFPPQYPIFPGEPIRYHFLFYMLVGMLEKIGLPLDWALNIPSILGFTLLLWGIWSLAIAMFKDKKVAMLSIIFFLFNGSLSFLKFFRDHPLSVNTPFDIIRANAFPAFGPWDGGVISAFWNLNIYTNQRHLAWGFALGIWFLIWILSAKKSMWSAILWGVAIGLLPSFHQPMLPIFAILLTWYFLTFPRLRLSLILTGITTLLLIVPQRNLFGHWDLGFGISSLWYPGYLIHDHLSLPTFLDFWFQNVGLHAMLIPLGFFLIPKHTRHILFPLVLLFAIGNLFKFSMEVAANHKFFNFALILGNMITAYVIILFIRHIKPFIGRICIFVGFVGFITLSGVIDFFVIINDTKGALPDVGNNQTATWIAQNTPKDAVFLNSSFLYHPASLAGRKIFMGWPYFAWSAGYDTYKRNDEMKRMYESQNPNIFCPLLKHHNISYVTVEDTNSDPNLPNIDVAYFRASFQPVFTDSQDNIHIYETASLCR